MNGRPAGLGQGASPPAESFLDSVYRKSLSPLRFLLLLGAALFGGVFLAFDRLVLPPESFGQIAIVRLTVGAVLLLIAGFSYFPIFRRMWQGAIAVALFAVGAGAALMARFVPAESTFVALIPSAFTLFVFAAFTAVRLRPLWSTLLAVALILCFNGIAWERGFFDASEWFGHNVMLFSVAGLGLGVGRQLWKLLERDHAQLWTITQERKRADRLLSNILPDPIAERLKDGEQIIADFYEEGTVLFADICGFSELQASPAEMVRYLNTIFSAFDRLAGEHGIEKIKTIGDAYMAVAGVPEPRDDHAAAAAELALKMQQAVHELNKSLPFPLQIRIGIHSGPLVAGVIGTHKFSFDLWGETVNTASRMESHGVPGQIQISETVHQRLSSHYECRDRGVREFKGIGACRTFILEGRRHSGAPTAPSRAGNSR